MRLIRWFLRKRYQRTMQRVEQQRSVSNERKRCIELLNEITVSQFALYEASSGTSTTIRVPDKDIDLYIERIKQARQHIRFDRALNSDTFNWTLKTVTVDQFMTSTQGFYQDVEKAVERLRVAALDLCEAMEKHDDAEYGIAELNSRLLTKLFINLQDVSKALIEVSLTN